MVNERAEPGETVVVPIGVENAKPFQRGDLKFADSTDDIPGAEYVLYCPGAAHVKPEMPEFVLVHQVTSGDAVFAEVWGASGCGAPESAVAEGDRRSRACSDGPVSLAPQQ